MLESPDRERLFGVCWTAIERGADDPWRKSISAGDYPPRLRDKRATFVTLSKAGALRGCCGRLRPTRPLVVDAADNAWTTAFRDPRFEPLAASELPELTLELSLLSPLTRLNGISGRGELLERLHPGRDGLLIRAGSQQATFLPKVWQSLPDPEAFLEQLLAKGGFVEWPETAQVFTYTADCIAEAYAERH